MADFSMSLTYTFAPNTLIRSSHMNTNLATDIASKYNSAMHASTGHTHDGTTGNGSPIILQNASPSVTRQLGYSGALQVYDGSVVRTYTTLDTAQTLSNKTVKPRQFGALYGSASSTATHNTGGSFIGNGVSTTNLVYGGSDDAGIFSILSTGSVSGTSAFVSYSTHTRLNHKFYALFKIALNQTSDTRLFCGFTSTASETTVGSDDPSATYLGLQFSSGRPDTNFQIAHKGFTGVSQTLLDTSIAVDTASHYFEVEMTSATTAVVTLYNSSFVSQYSTTISGITLSGSTGLRMTTAIINLAASLKTLYFYYKHYEMRP